MSISLKTDLWGNKGSFKRYVTPEGGREGSKLCYEPLRKSGGRGGGFSNVVT